MDILKGILGISVIILISFLFSNNKGLIKWRIVMSGILLQVVIAILVFKVPLFNQFLMAISGAFVKFLGFGLDGAAFLFGDLVRNSDAAPGVRHGLGFLFAFQALPIVIFFSSVAAALYYLGVLQKIVKAFAWVMSRTMKLSGAESLSAAGNIFLGQTEAPLLVRPFIAGMSQSELHCIMVGGMATIAGSVMGAYVFMLGGESTSRQVVFASYLLGASLMSAPAAVVVAKIFYPETKEGEINKSLEISRESAGVNIIDALAKGASNGLKLALNIGAMLLAFIAVIYTLNFLLARGLGDITGLNDFVFQSTAGVFHDFSLEYILGQVFRVFTFIMGVDWQDSLYVGSLLGQKVVINEFVAYSSLSEFIPQNVLNDKSILIATYSLCGFANFGSIAIQIGGIGSMAPDRKEDVSRLGIRALFAALLATMMTATIAGALF